MEGGNFTRSLRPSVPASGCWTNTVRLVKTAEIIPDPIRLIAGDGQPGLSRSWLPNQLIISEGF